MNPLSKRKKFVAISLIVAVLLSTSGIYLWRVKADSAVLSGGVKIQLTDIQGKEVKAPVLLEILVYGKVRVCQVVKIAFAKVSQCSDQNRAYTRYAATDQNGTYTMPSNIGKPLSDTELRDTLQKVVYSSGKNLESDDVSDILDNMKNIKIDDNPSFFMQAVQVVGAGYAAKFSGDVVKWTANQIKNVTTSKPASSTSSSNSNSSSTSSSSTSSTSSTNSTNNTSSGSTSTTSTTSANAPTQTEVEGSTLELTGRTAATNSNTTTDSKNSLGVIAKGASATVAVPVTATVDDVKNMAGTSAKKTVADIEVGKSKLAEMDVETAKQAGQIVLSNVITKTASIEDLGIWSSVSQADTNSMSFSLGNFGGLDANGKYMKYVEAARDNKMSLPAGSESWTNASQYLDWYNANMTKTDAGTVDVLNRLTMFGIATAGADQNLSDTVIKSLNSKNIPVQSTASSTSTAFTSSNSALANAGNNLWSAFRSGQSAASNATVSGTLANASRVAEMVKKDPASASSVAPNTAKMAGKDLSATATDAKTKKKKNVIVGFVQGLFSSAVQTSIKAGALIIPDPVSLGIALVYQAIGPRYEVVEKNFTPQNAIVNTLSERFDSGRVRVDFKASENKETSGNSTGVLQYFNLNNPTSASKKLQVVFRDEEVYNNTTTSFLAKAFETTTDTSSRNYMTGVLNNYKDYLLETQLRGTADTDTTITNSIKKIGNLICPVASTATTTTTSTSTAQ